MLKQPHIPQTFKKGISVIPAYGVSFLVYYDCCGLNLVNMTHIDDIRSGES